jgi:hypothetical protein
VGDPGRGGRPPGGRGRAVEAGDLLEDAGEQSRRARSMQKWIAARDSDRTRQRPPVVRGVLG